MKKLSVLVAVAELACVAGCLLRPAENTIVAELGGGVTMEMLPIPAGTFMIGSNNGDSYEKPVHQVTISKPFWMGKTEVTQAQYKQIMGKNPSHFQRLDSTNGRGAALLSGNDQGERQYPVENVSWYDAVEFCKKLTARERQAGRLPEGFEYTLPTEAQWEYACRAGSTTEYCFGDDVGRLDEYAWYGDNSNEETQPVAKKKPNAWGLYDKHGNVWEWCSDWYGDYPSGSVTDPQGVDSGSTRVLRGGSWRSLVSSCRSADRIRGAPAVAGDCLGFRVCLSAR